MVAQYYDLIRKKAVHSKEGLGKTQDRSIKSDEIPAIVFVLFLPLQIVYIKSGFIFFLFILSLDNGVMATSKRSV